MLSWIAVRETESLTGDELNEVKRHIGTLAVVQNVGILRRFFAAIRTLESKLHRAIWQQTITAWYGQAYFSKARWDTVLPEIQSLTSVTMYDTVGDPQDVDKSAWFIDNGVLPSELEVPVDFVWSTYGVPRTQRPLKVITVHGYGVTYDSIAPEVMELILQYAGFMFENRQAEEMPADIRQMITDLTVYEITV